MGAGKNNQCYTYNQQRDNRQTASLITNHGFIPRRGTNWTSALLLPLV